MKHLFRKNNPKTNYLGTVEAIATRVKAIAYCRFKAIA